MTVPQHTARRFFQLLARLHAATDLRTLERVERTAARQLGRPAFAPRATREWLLAQFRGHREDCGARVATKAPFHGRPPSPAEWAKLTQREREVMALLPLGLTDAQVAGRLGIARATVSKHLEHILAKTGTETRTAAVAAVFGGPK